MILISLHDFSNISIFSDLTAPKTNKQKKILELQKKTEASSLG